MCGLVCRQSSDSSQASRIPNVCRTNARPRKKYSHLKKLLKKVAKILGAALKLRQAIDAALRSSGRVKLTDNRKKLVLDALCKMPDLTAAAITAEDNINAFRTNGQNVDGRPSYKQMLNTCIRDISETEEQLLWKHLPEMIQLVDKPELSAAPVPTPGLFACMCLRGGLTHVI